MQTTKVAIVGMGTVGSGVARLLLDHGDRTARHAGRTLWLEQVVVQNVAKPRDADLPDGILTDSLTAITENPEISVVAQLIGGLEPARTIMLELLESGKDVVTANKALLAEHGGELFDRARELGRSIAFEAAVAGGIPVITAIGQCLSANQITSLRGILNGTSNYIVSKMSDEGADYNEALKQAQQLGFAEADPTLDVNGTDTAQKLAILAHLAFGARLHWKNIPTTGIDQLNSVDLEYAHKLGYRIKLLASAELAEFGLQVHVAPTLVKIGRPLAEVREAYNALSIVGDAVGRAFFHGLGAGQMPTASAVVADMIDTAVGRTKLTFQTLKLWSQQEARVDVGNHGELPGRYYLRFHVNDSSGVLSKIAGILGDQGVSIASVIQHEANQQEESSSKVPLVIMTHQTTEGSTATAIELIDQLPEVEAGTVRLRVLD
jgi:homoserine dehydrogenase